MKFQPTCRFCGQTTAADDDFDNQQEADEWATLQCCCTPALNYQEEHKRKQKREENIKKVRQTLDDWEKYCEEKSIFVGILFDETNKKMLVDIATKIIDNEIKAASISTYHGIKIKIGMTAKDKVLINFAYTNSISDEV